MIGIPDNVRLHLANGLVDLDEGCVLLPAPLTTSSTPRDLTSYMDTTPSPEGTIRVGLAHGAVVNFAGDGGDATNPISPERAKHAGLSYLALGDWHRTQSINERTWYAGTPELDRMVAETVGKALLVILEGPGAEPNILECEVGTYRWQSTALELHGAEQLPDEELRLRRDSDPLSRLVLKLSIRGDVALAARSVLSDWLERVKSVVCYLEYEDFDLRITPTELDLEAINFDGILRRVAESLKARTVDPSLTERDRHVAEEALVTCISEPQIFLRFSPMMITHIALEGVGRFRKRHIVAGLGPSLNLLCAPNEAGKSTIMRALRASLFARHGGTNEEIRMLGSLGAQLPATVEVGFECGDTPYLVRKSFLRSTGCTLLKAGQPFAEGRSADEQVWTILGVLHHGEGTDEFTFGLLWVDQGASLEPVEIGTETSSILSQLIEAEVGNVLGGERGERVRQGVIDDLAREETSHGSPRSGGEWKAAGERLRNLARTARRRAKFAYITGCRPCRYHLKDH